MGWLRRTLFIGGLAAWYTFTSPSSQQLANKKEYPLPTEIKVVETSLPHETKKRVSLVKQPDGKVEPKEELEKIVRTADIDFSKNFYVKTDRYKLIKDEDWLPSRLIGHTLSIPGKVFFGDWNYAWGQDAKRTRAALSMLEGEKSIKDITVRLNHNEALYDIVRMLSDDKLSERNNLAARILIGIPLSLGDEIWAEFSRGSYYNPLTRTAVCYSNIESITAHEIGHHKDFQRFSSDWGYMLARTLPPVMLYQEWQASQNAKKQLSKDDQWQFDRFLLSAFMTYLIASYYISRKILQRNALHSNGDERDIDKLGEDEKPQIHPLQTLRHFGTMNAELYAGIAAYNATSSQSDFLSYAAFAGAIVGTKLLADTVLKRIVPYEHENV